ncbi:hypothetical protein Tco_0764416 [Tanacetum coccineum]
MEITVVTLVEEQMSSWKGNLPKLPIIIKYSAIESIAIDELDEEMKVCVEWMGCEPYLYSNQPLEAKPVSVVEFALSSQWFHGLFLVLKILPMDGSEFHNRNLQAILANGVVLCSTLSNQGYAKDFYDQ